MNRPAVPKEATVSLRVHVQKIGTKGTGIFQGPVALVEFGQLATWVRLAHFLETWLTAAMGFLLFGTGVYYLLVFGLIPERKYHLWFALTAIALAGFEISVSRQLYRITDRVSLLMFINAFSAIAATNAFFVFLKSKFNLMPRWMLWLFLVFSTSIIAAMLIGDFSLDRVYELYVVWIRLFILLLLLSYWQFVVRKRWLQDATYSFGFSVLILSALNDVGTELGLAETPYMVPYGFAVFTVAVALGLAKEFATAFRNVELQVSERTSDLARALDQLRTLEKMKERFFSNISHDFKTPIAVALGAIDDVRTKMANSVAASLAPADRSLRRLLQMITNMLDTVKAESGTLKMEWKKAHIAELIRKWAEPFRVLCDRKGLDLQIMTEGFEALEVPIDVLKMERVFDNLLSNAVKFTDRRKDPERRANPANLIQIRLRTDEARFYIEVSDSGMGVPPEERGQIFDRYFQSSRTSLREHGGSGIGLSFAKEMVELHNGKIWVEEADIGGSKFVVALPLSQDVESLSQYRPEPEAERKEDLRGSLDVAYPPEAPTTEDPERPTILVAEDNPEIAQIIAKALADEFNVHFAQNGRRALELLNARAFDGLLTDLVMPEMRGDELIRAVREEPRRKALPVIVLSSHGEEETVVSLLRSGANDYVTKPFHRDVLLARLRAQISSYRTTRWASKVDKLRELGQLSAGIAHQAKNRMGKMGNNLDLYRNVAFEAVGDLQKHDPTGGTELLEKLKRIHEIVRRGYDETDSLIQSMDRYSSGSKNRMQFKLAECVKTALELHSDRIKGKGATVELNRLEDLAFEGYNEIVEALVNIIGNAVDALPEDGSGQLKIDANDMGNQIAIRIRDNGVGIASEVLPRIFDPFFTTKDPGKGTGLGLYLVRDYIELKLGGRIQIVSEGIGKGSTVTLLIPKVAPNIAVDEPLMHKIEV